MDALLINEAFFVEVGGANKTAKSNSEPNTQPIYIAADDIEYGAGNKIPLWLFGFLY